MAPINRIIIDTDPGQAGPSRFLGILIDWKTGVDDILAMLLALAAKPEEIEILLLSVTYGNVEVQRYGYVMWTWASLIRFVAAFGMLSLSSMSLRRNWRGGQLVASLKALALC